MTEADFRQQLKAEIAEELECPYDGASLLSSYDEAAYLVELLANRYDVPSFQTQPDSTLDQLVDWVIVNSDITLDFPADSTVGER